MGFPDRKKLAEVLQGGMPPGADPVAAGAVAPPEAGGVPPREGPTEQELEQAGAAAGAPGGEAAGMVAGMPSPEGAGGAGAQLMPENLTPEQQEMLKAELALAARRKMAGM